jgi:hypothetical protein
MKVIKRYEAYEGILNDGLIHATNLKGKMNIYIPLELALSRCASHAHPHEARAYLNNPLTTTHDARKRI